VVARCPILAQGASARLLGLAFGGEVDESVLPAER
jgi:hypothetical protein